jgi:hypothetical protein
VNLVADAPAHMSMTEADRCTGFVLDFGIRKTIASEPRELFLR